MTDFQSEQPDFDRSAGIKPATPSTVVRWLYHCATTPEKKLIETKQNILNLIIQKVPK